MSINRITGITSGMDTDAMIKDLMKVEKMKIDEVDRKKTYTEWEQESYREMTNVIRAFKDEYFDVLNRDTNFRSTSAFSEFTESVTVSGEDVEYLTVAGTSSIKSYTHEIESITQLATSDEWNTDELEMARISGDAFVIGDRPATLQFSLTIDDVTKTIDIGDTSSMNTMNKLINAIDDEIVAEFGDDYTGIVQESAAGDSIYFVKPGSDVTILARTDHEAELTWLGFESGESSNDYLDQSINELFGISDVDLADMTINDVTLSDLGLTSESSLEDLTSAISDNSAIRVELSYSSMTDKLFLQAEDMGSANEISMSATFMSKLGFSDVDDGEHHISGENAKMVLDGVEIVKSSNDFTLDGIRFSLNEVYTGPGDPIEIKIDNDTDVIKDKIKAFVTTYNGLIATIDAKLNEFKDRDFNPLTDEEKESLSDDEIERWESKAKSGILRGNSVLSNMLSKMRTSLYESVEGVGITLSDLGIQTSTNYKDKGKLVIDEDDLTDALENNFEEVVNLFTNQSEHAYLDSDHTSDRYNENGLSNRLFDIIEDNIRVYRNTAGYKGTLLVKAGMVGDVTESENVLSNQIEDFDTRIERMFQAYYEKEDNYYLMFANMEAAMSKLQSQGSAMLSQLGM